MSETGTPTSTCRSSAPTATTATCAAKLQTTLERNGPKAIIGNRGFAPFVKIQKGSVTIGAAAVRRDARLDGKFVLTTNTDLPASEVALTYKSLWRVERAFREEKSTLEVQPIFHHRDDTSIGHIVASFLALRLEVDLRLVEPPEEGARGAVPNSAGVPLSC